MTILTYGTASASYLATKCLAPLTETVREKSHRIVESIAKDFYIDNLLTNEESLVTAANLLRSIHETLLTGGFRFRKYLLQELSGTSTENGLLEFMDASISCVLSML